MSGYVTITRKPLTRLKSRLGRLDIELTERCNHDCLHCCINLPSGDHEARAREMTTAQVKRVLVEAVTLGCLQVRFTGGEPLVRPDFSELYRYARGLGLKVLIFTNATLIDTTLARLLSDLPPLVRMEITCYGMSPASYEAATGHPGSHARFTRGVELLLTHRVPFIVKYALLPPNRHEVDAFEAWAATLPWMDKKPGYSLFFDLRNRRDDEQKNRRVAALRATPAAGLALLTRDREQYRRGTLEFAGKFMGPPGDQLFRCGAGKGLCIDAYGLAQPCMGIRVPALTVPVTGADSTHSLQDALDRFSSLSEIRSTNPAYLERCAVCFLKGLCEQCPAKSWAEHGDLDTPVEYLCQVAHAQARFLGWLSGEEEAWQVKDWRSRITGEG